MFERAHPARIEPPEFVAPRRVRAPSDERESRVEVDESKETDDPLELKRSRPANAPPRPTLPMRSKSTSGSAAMTKL